MASVARAMRKKRAVRPNGLSAGALEGGVGFKVAKGRFKSGGRASYIMTAHILPNVATPLIVAVTLTIGRVILIEPVRASWGSASWRPRQAGAICSTTRRNW